MARPPLLIAVTSRSGAEKTPLLAAFAARQAARVPRVEGVLTLPGDDGPPVNGAVAQRLRLVACGSELPWAMRDDTLDPPYYFEPDTERKLRRWADGLQATAPAPVLLLDEFGEFELRGLGLMPLWPTLVAARPEIVVIATHDSRVAAVEKLVGQRFDLRIEAGAPDALDRLESACRDFREWGRLGLYGAAAGGIETTAGTMLHLAVVPFRGLLLSSMQAAMMTFAGFGLSRPGRVVWVPLIAAGLKALSPAGSRVRPMLAIGVQGLLFGGTVQLCGWNLFAVLTGGFLVGAWSAAQGILLQYLLLGGDLVGAYDMVVLWLAERWSVSAPPLPWLAALWIGACGVFAAACAVTAWGLRSPPAKIEAVIHAPRHRTPTAIDARATARGFALLREWGRWQFWLPLVVVSFVLLRSGRSWEHIGWLSLRFLAVSLVLLSLLSLLRPARWAEQLRRRGRWGPAVAWSGAVGESRD